MSVTLKHIRKTHYRGQRKKMKQFWFDMDDWLRNPYSCFKARFYIETSAIIVFFVQYTKITPNLLTFICTFLGILSGIFLASNNQNLIFISLLILFSKNSIDWADGLLARVKKQTSTLGAMLDDWAALVSSYSYLIGLGIYLYHKSGDEFFIILTFFIIIIKAIDIKDFAYHYSMYEIVNSKKKFSKSNNVKKNNKYGVSNNLILLKNFFQNFLDERSRTVDLICLLIFIDTFYIRIEIIEYIYYLIFLKYFVIFSGGFYITYFKNFLPKLK